MYTAIVIALWIAGLAMLAGVLMWPVWMKKIKSKK